MSSSAIVLIGRPALAALSRQYSSAPARPFHVKQAAEQKGTSKLLQQIGTGTTSFSTQVVWTGRVICRRTEAKRTKRGSYSAFGVSDGQPPAMSEL